MSPSLETFKVVVDEMPSTLVLVPAMQHLARKMAAAGWTARDLQDIVLEQAVPFAVNRCPLAFEGCSNGTPAPAGTAVLYNVCEPCASRAEASRLAGPATPAAAVPATTSSPEAATGRQALHLVPGGGCPSDDTYVDRAGDWSACELRRRATGGRLVPVSEGVEGPTVLDQVRA